MSYQYNQATQQWENTGETNSTPSIKSPSIARKENRLQQYGYDTEVKPKTSIVEKLLEILPRSESFSANLLGRGDVNKAFSALFKGDNKLTYTDLLKEAGMGDNLGTKIAGFGLGTVLDPLTYLPIGKIAGGIGKVGRKVPGISNLMGFGDDVIKSAKKAVGMQTLTGGMKDADTILKGITGRTNFAAADNFTKYKPIFEGMLKMDEDKLKLVGRAMEKPNRYLKQLDEAGLTLYSGLTSMMKETGETKQTLGIVKELIGGEKVKQLTGKGIPVGKKFLGLGGAEADAYLPHMITDEFRQKIADVGKTPDEMIELLKGMSRRGVAKKEKVRTLMGTIADLNRQSQDKYGMDIFESDLKKIVPKYLYNYSRNTSLVEMNKELLKLTDEAGEALIKPIKNNKVAGNMVKLSGLPYEAGYQTSPEMAKMINRVTGVLSSDPTLNKFMKGFDKAQNVWKTLVTVPNPSFHVNNLIGAQFNNFIKDPDSLSADTLLTVQKMLGKNADKVEIVAKNGNKISGAEFLDYLKKHGVLTTFITPEKMAKNPNLFEKGVEKFGGGVERVARAQLAVSQYKKTGNLLDAVRATWEVHGNYAPEAMGSFEKNVVKRAIPFWTWMKTNIPFQIKGIINNTGKYTALARAQNQMVSPEERSTLPEWMRGQFMLPTKTREDGQKVVRTVNLPAENLNDLSLNPLESARKLVTNNLSPLVKAPLEWSVNKNLFYDRPLVDKDLPFNMQKGPAPAGSQYLPDVLKNLIGYQQSSKVSEATGKDVPRLEMDARLSYLLNQLGPIKKFANAPKTAQDLGWDEGNLNTIMAALAGWINPLPPRPFDPREQKFSEQKRRENELQNRINYLIQRGLIPKLK